jgi:hypothetical protein
LRSFSVLSSHIRTWKALPSRTWEKISSIVMTQNVQIKTDLSKVRLHSHLTQMLKWVKLSFRSQNRSHSLRKYDILRFQLSETWTELWVVGNIMHNIGNLVVQILLNHESDSPKRQQEVRSKVKVRTEIGQPLPVRIN